MDRDCCRSTAGRLPIPSCTECQAGWRISQRPTTLSDGASTMRRSLQFPARPLPLRPRSPLRTDTCSARWRAPGQPNHDFSQVITVKVRRPTPLWLGRTSMWSGPACLVRIRGAARPWSPVCRSRLRRHTAAASTSGAVGHSLYLSPRPRLCTVCNIVPSPASTDAQRTNDDDMASTSTGSVLGAFISRMRVRLVRSLRAIFRRYFVPSTPPTDVVTAAAVAAFCKRPTVRTFRNAKF